MVTACNRFNVLELEQQPETIGDRPASVIIQAIAAPENEEVVQRSPISIVKPYFYCIGLGEMVGQQGRFRKGSGMNELQTNRPEGGLTLTAT